VAFLYNDIEKMLDDQEFNLFDKADYTIFGNMSDNIVAKYQKQLGQAIPKDLVALVTDKSEARTYIRRGFDNVVFHQDLQLDPPQLAAKPKSRARSKQTGRVASTARRVAASVQGAVTNKKTNVRKGVSR
jgi:hypothetical protein